jgi:hypothetical protein
MYQVTNIYHIDKESHQYKLVKVLKDNASIEKLISVLLCYCAGIMHKYLLSEKPLNSRQHPWKLYMQEKTSYPRAFLAAPVSIMILSLQCLSECGER